MGRAFAIFAVIAVLLAGLGLFALSIAAAERRTKEIGNPQADIRKRVIMHRAQANEFSPKNTALNSVISPKCAVSIEISQLHQQLI